jgi:hypothetical protein
MNDSTNLERHLSGRVTAIIGTHRTCSRLLSSPWSRRIAPFDRWGQAWQGAMTSKQPSPIATKEASMPPRLKQYLNRSVLVSIPALFEDGYVGPTLCNRSRMMGYGSARTSWWHACCRNTTVNRRACRNRSSYRPRTSPRSSCHRPRRRRRRSGTPPRRQRPPVRPRQRGNQPRQSEGKPPPLRPHRPRPPKRQDKNSYQRASKISH